MQAPNDGSKISETLSDARLPPRSFGSSCELGNRRGKTVRDDSDSKLNQLMGYSIAHGIMVQTLLGMIVTKTRDWRGCR